MLSKPKIIVFAESPEVLALLRMMLEIDNIEVIGASCKNFNILELYHIQPDLIMIDDSALWDEVATLCERIKADHLLGNIPIMLIAS